MTGFSVIRIPKILVKLIDKLVERDGYSSRTAFVNDVIRKELRARKLLPSG